eukprot:gb/GECG01010444.1/.p1 GENE.gb/GECG01010444.1/~~gb/GECG01010444.1/.p1  ORF type:complete len:421 (+),score=30.79 gb/GECG01010444.1/:1-1263(+)
MQCMNGDTGLALSVEVLVSYLHRDALKICFTSTLRWYSAIQSPYSAIDDDKIASYSVDTIAFLSSIRTVKCMVKQSKLVPLWLCRHSPNFRSQPLLRLYRACSIMAAAGSMGTSDGAELPSSKRQCCQEDNQGLSERQLREPKSVETTSLDTLWRDHNYIAVSKPPDVRMDGEHEVTLEKLIRHNHGVEKVHNTHRLDYATSGAICLAATKAGAAYLSGLFEDRLVCKSYSALLEGSLTKECCKKLPENVELSWVTANYAVTVSEESLPYATMDGSQSPSFSQVTATEKERKQLDAISRSQLIDAMYSTLYQSVGSCVLSFTMRAPVAEPTSDDNFCMEIGCETNPGRVRAAQGFMEAHEIHTAELFFNLFLQYAETLVRVLGYTKMWDTPCTRVQLIPKTGRRHQLRLHMAALGHRIGT